MKKQEVYHNDVHSALINPNGQFVYEVFVYIHYDNIFIMNKHQLYYSDKELKIVETKKINSHVEMHCYLYSAPKEWLEKNNFVLYINPKTRIKNGQNIVSD